MAKLGPRLSLAEMEGKLGYELNSSGYPVESDFRPFSTEIYERTKKELEEHEKQKFCGASGFSPSINILPELDEAQSVVDDQCRITLTRRSHVGLYNVAVDIRFSFGLYLPLLFTTIQASNILNTAKLQHTIIHDQPSIFFKLPREVRDRIYDLVLQRGEWKVRDVDSFDRISFPRSLGDPSGFYFPPSRNISILRTSKQIRQEVLPLAYHKTVFKLDDIDDLVKVLIAIGEIGRCHIRSLELTWQSTSDTEYNWDQVGLPTLHTHECAQLLQQCKSIRYLRLYFDGDSLNSLPPDACRAEPGIRELCSVQGIETVDMLDWGHQPLEQRGIVKFMKQILESAEE